jgi:hypothetical protein
MEVMVSFCLAICSYKEPSSRPVSRRSDAAPSHLSAAFPQATAGLTLQPVAKCHGGNRREPHFGQYGLRREDELVGKFQKKPCVSMSKDCATCTFDVADIEETDDVRGLFLGGLR